MKKFLLFILIFSFVNCHSQSNNDILKKNIDILIRGAIKLKAKDFNGALEDCNLIINSDGPKGSAVYTLRGNVRFELKE